jgi:hypothetical protein
MKVRCVRYFEARTNRPAIVRSKQVQIRDVLQDERCRGKKGQMSRKQTATTEFVKIERGTRAMD